MGGVVEAVTPEEGDDAAEAERRQGGTISAETPRRRHHQLDFRPQQPTEGKEGTGRRKAGGRGGAERKRI